MKLSCLIWNDWNVAHIARRGFSEVDVEVVVTGAVRRPLVERSREGVLAVWGVGRRGEYLLVVLSPRVAGAFYPVTVRRMTDRERRRYRRWLG